MLQRLVDCWHLTVEDADEVGKSGPRAVSEDDEGGSKLFMETKNKWHFMAHV